MTQLSYNNPRPLDDPRSPGSSSEPDLLLRSPLERENARLRAEIARLRCELTDQPRSALEPKASWQPSERDLRVLIENLYSGVALVDAGGRFTLVNDRFLKMFALSTDSDVNIVNDTNWSAWQVFDSDGRLLHVEDHPVRKAAHTRQAVRNQLVGVRVPGGSDLTWMLVSAAPLLSLDGSLKHLICTYYDITDRKRTDEALAKALADARGYYPFVDPDGSPSLLDADIALAERRLAEAALKGLNETLSRRVAERTAELQRELKARAKVTRLYAVLSQVNESIVRCTDERRLHEDVCRILAEVGGYPLAWIGQVTGDRVLPTAAAGSAKDYLDGITVTLDGALGAGPAGTAIREGRTVINDDFAANDVVAPWSEPALRYGLRASTAVPLRRNGVVSGKLSVYSTEPGSFDEENVRLLEALAADVSYAQDAIAQEHLRTMAEHSLAESEARLREVDRQRSQFLAVLSHELRNPLTPIRNSLFILDRAAPGGVQASKAKQTIERQVGQLARLVDDLLDLTRLTQGKLRLDKARINLTDVVRRVAEDHRASIEKAGLAFDVRAAGGPLWLDGDDTRLAQAVGNLLNNATKFTRPGGNVALTVEACSPEAAAVRVTDTGVGIEKAHLARLFEPFMQADSSLDRSKGGLGLGLALVKGVVEMHGGTVEARSDGLGAGAEFVIRLPVEAQSSQPVPEKQPSAPPAPLRIVIIEDNLDAADSLRDLLEFGGHRVEVAYDGPQGVDKARALRPDFVLCDIGLPGIDGYAVAKLLRADGALRSTRLIALTGYAQPEDIHRAKAAGFDGHIAKPPSLQRIEEVLASSR